MTEPQRIDFRPIIADIIAAGISRYKIACMMHRQVGQIQRWEAGVEPKHYEGEMLLMIHTEYVTLQKKPSGLQKVDQQA